MMVQMFECQMVGCSMHKNARNVHSPKVNTCSLQYCMSQLKIIANRHLFWDAKCMQSTRRLTANRCSMSSAVVSWHCSKQRMKGKGKGLDTCYSTTYMSQTRDQQRFTISEVAADWHSSSFETTLLNRACLSPYQYSIETMSVYRTVSETFSVKNGVTLRPGQGSFKVIENGAVRQIIYDFLLVGHCKHSSMFSAPLQ